MFNSYSIITSLQNELKTGNIIFDMLIGLFIAKLIEFIFTINILEYLYKLLNNIYTFRFQFIKGELDIRVKIVNSYEKNDYLEMINFLIKKNNININKISYNHQNANNQYLLITNLDNCLLENNIYIKITSVMKEENTERDTSVVANPYTIYTIKFYSYIYNSIKISNYIKEFIKIYEIDSTKKPQQITNNTHDSCNFISYKTFDNLFFEAKDNLIKIIKRFENSKDEYKRIGKQYSLTILLYGEAGCGKTSVLKALGNMLKRDIHTIHVNSTMDICDFNYIWFHNLKTQSIDYECLKNKIIHLPEIDYMCEQFLSDNLLNSSIDSSQTENKQNIVIQLNENKQHDNKSKHNCLTKAFFRELLDGVNEQEGRIIVLTTNNIERLDPILFRDGRIDIKIKFDKMSSICLQEYLEYIFKNKINENIILPNLKFSPATIQAIAEECLANNKTIYDCITILHNK
jgi:chaperone BCS1